MHVVVINRTADVRLVDEENCPGAHTKYSGPKIQNGYCSGCSYFMGCKVKGTENIGSEMPGCCWKKILEEEGK